MVVTYLEISARRRLFANVVEGPRANNREISFCNVVHNIVQVLIREHLQPIRISAIKAVLSVQRSDHRYVQGLIDSPAIELKFTVLSHDETRCRVIRPLRQWCTGTPPFYLCPERDQELESDHKKKDFLQSHINEDGRLG